MIPILNVFSSERPRPDDGRDRRPRAASSRWPTSSTCSPSTAIMFEPREVSQGDEATVRYLTTLKPTDSLEDLSAQLMGDGKDGHQECLLVAAETRLTRVAHRRASCSILPSGGRRCSASSARARRRLVLSLFRCDDFEVLDALAAALERGVRSRRAPDQARQGRQEAAAEAVGARSRTWALSSPATRDPVVKYHAKYLVADDRPRWSRRSIRPASVSPAPGTRVLDRRRIASVVRGTVARCSTPTPPACPCRRGTGQPAADRRPGTSAAGDSAR